MILTATSHIEGSEAPPNALAHWAEISAHLDRRGLAVFLDYDGTLAAIAPTPELATLSPEMHGVLQQLARCWPTTIVTGRERTDISALLKLDEVGIAANHGLDIQGPGSDRSRLQVGFEAVPVLRAAAEELRRRLAEFPGVLVEDKVLTLAIHYRLADRSRIPEIDRIVAEVSRAHRGLRRTGGKMVFELRPSTAWDKGKAVLWLLAELRRGARGTYPVYIGDDITDEDAFEAIGNVGLGIVVCDSPRPTHARYSLRDVSEVRTLLGRLAGLAREG